MVPDCLAFSNAPDYHRRLSGSNATRLEARVARWDREDTVTIPQWFWDAIDVESRQATVEIDDCDVFYQEWGDSSKPGVLLIHGMNAHSRWWDFIAPLLLDRFHVGAMDLTGMGDSDYRYSYNAETYAQEIVGVCDAIGFDSDVTVVGHSFGGVMATKAMDLYQDRFGALVLVDSGIRHPDEPIPDRPQMGGDRAKAYPDRETAEARFRLYPPQACANEFVLKYIAKQSVMRIDGGGWAWKFDEDLPGTLKGGERYPEEYAGLSLPVGIIYGSDSELFSKETLDYMLSLIPVDVEVCAIEGAQHHVFLDQPLEFAHELGDMIIRLRAH